MASNGTGVSSHKKMEPEVLTEIKKPEGHKLRKSETQVHVRKITAEDLRNERMEVALESAMGSISLSGSVTTGAGGGAVGTTTTTTTNNHTSHRGSGN